MGIEAPGRRAAAGAGRQGVGLVDHEEGSGRIAQGPQAVEEPRVRQHDADVGQRRLGQHGGDLPGGQRPLYSGEVVELDGHCGGGRIDGRADVAWTRHRGPVGAGDDEGLVDAPVVAVGENEDLRSPGDEAGQSQGPTVGIGGTQGERPLGRTEPAGQVGCHPLGVLGGEHGSDPAEGLHPPTDGVDHWSRGVSGHGPGVPQGEIDIGVAVDVCYPSPACRGQGQGEGARPVGHPRHRHPREEVLGPVELRT